ncbi:MAG: lecithin retinol acyltransferase family protein [Bacteroidetes bacterium]|nr:lecithin retinol acyltransferase family protein [Bacteroidota bacterium]
MNYIELVVRQNKLNPADVIVLKKKFFGMVDHFAIFLGRNTKNEPLFAANYTKGTRLIDQNELNEFLQTLEPNRIERFVGTMLQRNQAIKRALSKLGENDYNYLSNNCEHYKNFVQTGVPRSEQVENLEKGVVLGGVVLLFAAILGSK